MNHNRTIVLVSLALGLATSLAWAASHTGIQRSPVGPGLRVMPTPPQTPPAVQPAPLKLEGPALINLKTLTNKQIRALSDSAVVEFQGKPTTMGALRALGTQDRRGAETKLKAAAAQAKAKFEARRAQFLRQQQVELQAAHVKARAEVARLRQASATIPATQQEAIRNEAIQLQHRAKTASPAEQAQIEQRALQLQQQYQQLQRLQKLPR
jgi:hypothetical protein